MTQFFPNPPRNPASDQIRNLAEQTRNILWSDEDGSAGMVGVAVGFRVDQRRSRLVFHQLGVREHFQSRFGRFHLEIGEHKLVLLIIQFLDSLGSRSGRIDPIPACLQESLQGKTGGWIIVHNEYSR